MLVLIVHHTFINNRWRFNDDRVQWFAQQLRRFAPPPRETIFNNGIPGVLEIFRAGNGIRTYGRCVYSRPTCCRAAVRMLHGRRGLCFVGSLSDRNHPYLLLDFDHLPLEFDDQSDGNIRILIIRNTELLANICTIYLQQIIIENCHYYPYYFVCFVCIE